VLLIFAGSLSNVAFFGKDKLAGMKSLPIAILQNHWIFENL
jgi:hypothetical protein